jgi:hypothetical protein
MSLLTDDLKAIFADTALTVSVVYGTSPVQQTRGHLTTEDVPENDEQGGVVLVSRRVVVVRGDALDDLENDETITVDGTDYKIHRVRNAGRGKTRITLA